MIIELTFADVLRIVLTSVFTGIGVTIGTYLTNRHFIERLERNHHEKQ